MENKRTHSGYSDSDCLGFGKNLEDSLSDAYFLAKNRISDAVQELVSNITLSVRKNNDLFEESADNIYYGMKNAFRNVFGYYGKEPSADNDGKINFIFTGGSQRKIRKASSYAEDAKIVYGCENKGAKKSLANNNYTSLINNFISTSRGAVNSVAAVISGKFCNSYEIRDRKPKRLWRWNDRIEYLEGYLTENKLSVDELGQVKLLGEILSKNKYLKFRRRDCFNRLGDLLKNYYGEIALN